ncbi:hypothetical protein M0R04_05050 [Candidatus Dojkabacteria bacterium]|jgi:hypothetical protein|nr:hypothetical protein [Candidatus Dojkabacteria bacterium]
MVEIDRELEELRYAWQYQGEIFTENLIGKSIGFIYEITNKTNGRKYLGRKLFTKAKTKINNGKKIKSRVESTWMTYYGSNIELNEDVKRLGRDSFDRVILHLCDNKSDLNYLETFHIFNSGSLLSDDYYNRWCSFKGNAKYIKITKNP